MGYKLLSLFDGSGGFPFAAYMCGIEPVMASEVEPYPIAVTKSRFPNMKHLGDVSKVHGYDIEPVDVISFGSPCQDLSCAGKQAGIKHIMSDDDETTRSGLFLDAIRIIKEMRSATNGNYPKFAIWENVTGAFQSNSGDDFKIVLNEFIHICEPDAEVPKMGEIGWPQADCYMGDGWSVAYRTFNSQYWGVPQRRRRIYLVADFTGECAGKVLFERGGLSRNYSEIRASWKKTTGNVGNCIESADRKNEKVISVSGFDGQAGSQRDIQYADEFAPTLKVCTVANVCIAKEGQSFKNNEIEKINDKVLSVNESGAGSNNGYVYLSDIANSLCTSGGIPDQGYAAVLYDKNNKVINMNKDDIQSKAVIDPNGIAPCLSAGELRYGGGECYVLDNADNISTPDNKISAIAYSFDSLNSNSMKSNNPNSGCNEVNIAKTLDTSDGNPSKNQGGIAIVEINEADSIPEKK